MEEILQLIRDERARQDVKWGIQRHTPSKWLDILMEELGEAAKAVLEDDPAGYANELVHVAAVAVVALESHRDIERRRSRCRPFRGE